MFLIIHRKWLPEEIADIVQRIAEGQSISATSAATGRAYSSIQKLCKRLGLISAHTGRPISKLIAPSRPCANPQCSNMIVRRENTENHSKFMRRQYCSAKCHQAARRAQRGATPILQADGSKCCERCGVIFVRQAHQAADEFAKRRFCSMACAQPGRVEGGRSTAYTTQGATIIDPKRLGMPAYLRHQYDQLPASEQAKIRAAWRIL